MVASELVRRCVSLLKEGRPVLLHGASGSGKTTLARRVAEELGLKTVEISGFEPAALERFERLCALARDVEGNETLIIFDELEGVARHARRLKDLLMKAAAKIILIAEDSLKFSALRSVAAFVFVPSPTLVVGSKLVRDYRHARMVKEHSSELLQTPCDGETKFCNAIQSGDYRELSLVELPKLLDYLEKERHISDAYVFVKFLALADFSGRLEALTNVKACVKRGV